MSPVWQNLPEDLQSKIAEEHLPLISLIRLRSVSTSWSKPPRLRPAALSALHIHRSFTINSTHCRYTLRKKKKRLRLLKRIPSTLARDTTCLSCINGLLAFSVCPLNYGIASPVHFELCNIFTGGAALPTWTEIHPSPAPDRDPVFTGMSKLPSPRETGEWPSIGSSGEAKLSEDYILVAGMVDWDESLERSTSLLLQVYRGGVWSSSLFSFPEGQSLMYSNTTSRMEKCGVLRGSTLFFLLMRLDFSSASLCCIDVLSSDKSCRVVCELEPWFVGEWALEDPNHPKLAVCSGKLVLVHRGRVGGGEERHKWVYTTFVQEFDEEKRVWRCVSWLPEELRGEASFCPHGISDGGDELVVADHGKNVSFSYNLVTRLWSISCCSKLPGASGDVVPISIVY